MLPLKKILWPTDFSEPAAEGLKVARELAVQFSGEILLVHVIAPMPTMHGGAAPAGFHIPAVLDELQESAQNLLDNLRRDEIPAEIEARSFVIHGRPAREIVQLAEEENVDIIVIPTQGESGWQRFVFGSVAEKVIRHAECPVLTIQAPKEESN